MIDNTAEIKWQGWETVRLIGSGSFGTVYEIQRDIFGEREKAALKVITIPKDGNDIEELHNEGYDDESIRNKYDEHLRGIVTEYAMMRKLGDCANVVKCEDVHYERSKDEFGWNIFIKMELLTPLSKIAPETLSEENIIKLAKDLCAALIACKKYNIIHRDIKPQNIFMSSAGDFKLGDFGVAKTAEKTMFGTYAGTEKYMAPEVYYKQPYGTSADIYSLGLNLYWLLNNRRMPFVPADTKTITFSMEEEAKNRRLSGESLPAPLHGSEQLKNIVLKACAYNPENRYASAKAMLADINKLKIKSDDVDIIGDYDTQEDKSDKTFTFTADASLSVKTCTLEENIVQHPLSRSPHHLNNASDTEANCKSSRVASKLKIVTVISVLLVAVLCGVMVLFWPQYGEWSKWSESLPVPVEGRKTETAEQYRFQTKTLLETEETSVANGTLVSERKEEMEFGNWSKWQPEAVTENADCEVETKTQYRSRKINRTEEWSAWSNWSDWSATPATESESCAVRTRTVYSYNAFRYKCNYCDRVFSKLNVTMVVQADDHEFIPDEAVEKLADAILIPKQPDELSQILADAGYTYQTQVLYGIDEKLSINSGEVNYNGSAWYVDSSEPDKTEVQYATQTRERIENVSYSTWSDYTDTPLHEDESIIVETRTVYRYRTKGNVKIYTFEVLSDWSDWSAEKPADAENIKTEQRTVYRYCDKYTLWDTIFK